MSKKIVGKEKVDYVSKKTNQPVTGLTFHCVGDPVVKSERFEGKEVDTIFISSKSPMYAQCAAYAIGSEITVQYNRWGSVESVLLADSGKKG